MGSGEGVQNFWGVCVGSCRVNHGSSEGSIYACKLIDLHQQQMQYILVTRL